MLGKFTGQQKSNGGLDLARGDGGTLVVVGKSGGLGSDALEDVVHEGVHDGHGLGGDTSVGVDLFEHLRWQENKISKWQWAKFVVEHTL